MLSAKRFPMGFTTPKIIEARFFWVHPMILPLLQSIQLNLGGKERGRNVIPMQTDCLSWLIVVVATVHVQGSGSIGRTARKSRRPPPRVPAGTGPLPAPSGHHCPTELERADDYGHIAECRPVAGRLCKPPLDTEKNRPHWCNSVECGQVVAADARWEVES